MSKPKDPPKVKMPLEKAVKIANKIKDRLTPFADRISIAGSIRRETETVGDIELILTPKKALKSNPLFKEIKDQEYYPIYSVLDRLETQGKIRQILKGKKYRKFVLLDKEGEDIIKTDLFLVLPPDQFGVKLLIRTGPMVFSKSFVNAIKPDFKIEGNILWKYDRELTYTWNPLNTPDEEDVFKAVGLAYISPERRVSAVVKE